VLMVVEVYLLIKYVKAGVVAAMPELVQSPHEDESNDKSKRDVLEFAY
jgi:cytochrome D ubiquinol oxidase subunit 1